MNFFLLGIDHNTAPIEIREAVYWRRLEIAGFWADRPACRTAVLSTCNRLEIYGIAGNMAEAKEAMDIFRRRFGEYFANSYTVYGKDNVLRHLVRLASGLESQIKGELQIFSQLGAWAGREDLPRGLSQLVHQALLAAMDVRVEGFLNRPENNIAALLYEDLFKESYSDDILKITIVGTGRVAELFARYKPQGARLSFAAHKNILRARELARISGGTVIGLEGLSGILLKTDILISATSSPHRVFDVNYFSKIAALRERELYIYDLSVPRDIEPGVKEIDGIVLKNIDEVIPNVDHKSRHEAQPVSH